ncbi:Regulator_of chromosome condensation domain-containing protein [Hexamita inflata]|uniref:Putative n=1 Tax=Hexamita inflata TaxID=28002 RepID=A0ABP1KCK5_9EUKA
MQLSDSLNLYGSNRIVSQIAQNQYENLLASNDIQYIDQLYDQSTISKKLIKTKKLLSFFSKNVDSIVIKSIFSEIQKQIESDEPQFDKQRLEIQLQLLRKLIEDSQSNQNQNQQINNKETNENTSNPCSDAKLERQLKQLDIKYAEEQKNAQILYKMCYQDYQQQLTTNQTLNLQITDLKRKLQEYQKSVNLLLQTKNSFDKNELFTFIDQDKEQLTATVNKLKQQIKVQTNEQDIFNQSIKIQETNNQQLFNQTISLQNQLHQYFEQVQSQQREIQSIQKEKEQLELYTQKIVFEQSNNPKLNETLSANERLQRLESEQQQYIEELKQSNTTLKARLSSAEKQISEFKAEIVQNQVKFDRDKQQLQSLLQSQQIILKESLSKENLSNSQMKLAPKEDPEEQKLIEQLMASKRQDNIDMQRLHSQLQAEQAKNLALSKQIKEASISGNQSKTIDLSMQIAELQANKRSDQTLILNLQSKIQQSENQLNEVQKQVTTAQKEIKQKETVNEQLQTKINELNNELKQQSKFQSNNQNDEQLQIEKRQNKQLSENIDKLESQVDKYKEQIEQLNSQIDQQKEQLQQLKSQTEQQKARIQELANEKQKAEQQLKEATALKDKQQSIQLSFNLDDIPPVNKTEPKNQQVEQLTSQLEALTNKYNTLEKEKKALETSNNKLKEDLQLKSEQLDLQLKSITQPAMQFSFDLEDIPVSKPAAKQTNDASAQQLKEAQNKADALQKEKQLLEESNKKLKAEIQRLEQQVEQLNLKSAPAPAMQLSFDLDDIPATKAQPEAKPSSDLQAQLKQKDNEILALRADNQNFEKMLEKSSGHILALEQQISDFKQQISKYEREISDLKSNNLSSPNNNSTKSFKIDVFTQISELDQIRITLIKSLKAEKLLFKEFGAQMLKAIELINTYLEDVQVTHDHNTEVNGSNKQFLRKNWTQVEYIYVQALISHKTSELFGLFRTFNAEKEEMFFNLMLTTAMLLIDGFMAGKDKVLKNKCLVYPVMQKEGSTLNALMVANEDIPGM